MRLVQIVGYLAQSKIDPTSIALKMKTKSFISKTLYLGLDVHKAETVIAILESDRDAQPRHYGSIVTIRHALERAMRLLLRLNTPHSPTIKPLQTKDSGTIRFKLCLAEKSSSKSSHP